jgi:hypothetical protein
MEVIEASAPATMSLWVTSYNSNYMEGHLNVS